VLLLLIHNVLVVMLVLCCCCVVVWSCVCVLGYDMYEQCDMCVLVYGVMTERPNVGVGIYGIMHSDVR
jgi:hypothetical protein